MDQFDAAGVAVYALSYDEADALSDFAAAHGITYTLLSDPDSKVIEDYGILNTLIDPDDHPWYGIPYPGTYVTNAEGTITHKFFDSNLAVRAGPEQLLDAVRGQPGSLTSAAAVERAAVERAAVESAAVESAAAAKSESVTVSIALEGESLTPIVQKELVFSFHVPEERHVYAEPAPEGSVAVSVELDPNERLVTRPLIRPQSESHTLVGTDESFPVHHGDFQLRLPLTVNGGVADSSAGGVDEIVVSGEIRWQSCDDQVCDIPVRRRFECRLPVSAPPAVALGDKRGAELEPNAMAHFQKMTQRRSAS
jgi:hypothetical protein